jgi:hypothetical protein
MHCPSLAQQIERGIGCLGVPCSRVPFLTPAGSSIRLFADADRKGVRIAAVRNHASTNTLIPLLTQAELVCLPRGLPT